MRTFFARVVRCGGPGLGRRMGRACGWVLAGVLGLAANPAQALNPGLRLTQYQHRIWQMQQGLPVTTITAIGQTSEGYLWLGTPTGLLRFDGLTFTPMREIGGVSLENLAVRDLVATADNDLWVATDSGLLRLHADQVTRFSAADGLTFTNINHLFLDQQGVLWVCATDGLAKCVHDRFVEYPITTGALAHGNVRAAGAAKDGRIWVGGNGAQLAVWDGAQFLYHPLASVPPDADVASVQCDHDGVLWLGTTSGLVRISGGQERRFTTADGLVDDAVNCLTESADGVLWIGAKQGFSRLVKGEIESFRAKDGLSQSTVNALWQDREGSLWVGTKHGLNQFLDRRTIPFTVNEGLASNDTGPVLQDQNGVIWVGSLDAGLSRMDDHGATVLTTAQGLSSDTINTLAEDAPGQLWIGTAQGLDHWRDGKIDQVYTVRDGLPDNMVRTLLRRRDGTLWVGTAGGLVSWQNGRLTQPEGLDVLRAAPIGALAELPDGSLLVATQKGAVYAYAGGRAQPFAPAGAALRNVDAFYVDPGGLVWMGALGQGLFLLDHGKTFNFTTNDGLFDDDIYGVVADADGRLWMACSKGVFFVSRSMLLDCAAGRLRQVDSTSFSPTDALQTIECKPGVQPVVWPLRDGQLWFATTHGVSGIDPQRLQRNLPLPTVAIEDVAVNGDTRAPGALAGLAPGENNLAFRFAGLSFLSPDHITYRYKLEGYDQDWVDAGTRREAFYTNLPPGNYHFRVTARNVDGAYNPAESAVALVLLPHFYQRIWFWPLGAAVLALGAWRLYGAKIRRVQQQVQVILAERHRIARELHDTLLQGFSGITMEMQALAKRLPASPERATLDEIIQDAGASLRAARQSVVGLRSAQGADWGLAAALEQSARHLTEAKDIRLKLHLATDQTGLSADTEYDLLRIAQEAISNAVRHAGARTIEISLQRQPAALALAIKDDGGGFNRQVPADRYGLIGMKERAAHLGARFHLETAPGQGTTVCVELPLAAADPARPAA